MPQFGIVGERIGYMVHPGAGGPPLFLLHGFTASSATFADNIEELSQRFTVVTLDLLGHGDSDAPEESEAYAAEPAIERIIGLMDELGYGRVLLAGHSLGGALALRAALAAPDRFSGLVVLNSNSAAGDAAWREAARPRMEEMAAQVRAEGTGFLKESRLYPARSRRLPAHARRQLSDDFDALTPAGIAGTAERLVIDVNAAEDLDQLAVPTLIIIGNRDADFVRSAPSFIDRLPYGLVRTVTLEDAGHAANIEKPAEFNAALVAFADEIGYFPARRRRSAAFVVEPPASPRPRGPLLTGVGAALIVGGIALLAAAFLINRDDGDSDGTLAAAAERTATIAPTSAVAGARTAGPGSTPSPASSPSPSATTASPTATTAAALPNVPAATATPVPNTPTPEPTATPTSPTVAPTVGQSFPFVGINGPGSMAVGEPRSFSVSTNPAPARTDWSVDGADRGNSPSISVSFNAPGCHIVSVTALWLNPSANQAATVPVSVGGATCN